MAANPACPDAETAEKVVNEVWDSCFNDTRPFDEVRGTFNILFETDLILCI